MREGRPQRKTKNKTTYSLQQGKEKDTNGQIKCDWLKR